MIKVSRTLRARITTLRDLRLFLPDDDLERGKPNETLVHIYEKWAHGGFGIILRSESNLAVK